MCIRDRISADVGPDESMSDQKTPIVDDAETEPEPVTPPVEAPVTPEPAEDIAPAIVAPSAPVETSKPAPEEDVPGEETPGEETPGEENPGGETPGEENPGGETPGEENPGEPAVPTTPIVVSLADLCLDARAITYVTLNVSGEAGADIEALLGGSHGGADSTSLSDAGTGTIELRPGLVQILLGATVEIHYATEAGPVLPVTTSLSALGVTLESVLLAPACGAPAEDPVEDAPAVPTPDDTVVPAPEPTDEAAPAAPDEAAPAAPVEAPDAELAPETPAPEPAAPVEPSAPVELSLIHI